MKFMEKIRKNKKDNKGFSLVELIIVIAIMAILVGIVGTQVIPYLNRSREAKDQQILNSYSTAAVSAYASNAESITIGTTPLVVDMHTAGLTGDALTLNDAIEELVGYTAIPTANMSSTDGKAVTNIEVVYNFGAETNRFGITLPANSVVVIAYKGTPGTTTVVLDQVTSYL